MLDSFLQCRLPPDWHISILAAIILSSLFGGVLSVAVAALFAFPARAEWVPMLVSYTIGALLGAAFLEIIKADP